MLSRRRMLAGSAGAVGALALSRASATLTQRAFPGTILATESAPEWVQAIAAWISPGTGNDEEAINSFLSGPRVLLWGDFEGGKIVQPSNTYLGGFGVATYRLANGVDTAGWGEAVEGATSNVTIEGIAFNWNGENQASDTHGLRASGVLRLRILSCDFRGARHHNVTANAPASGYNSDWLIRDSRSWEPGKYASADGDGFRIDSGFSAEHRGALLEHCEAWEATHHNFHLGARVTARDCRAERGQNANYNLNGLHATLENCESGEHGLPGTSPTVGAIHVNTAANHARVDGCVINGSVGGKDGVIAKSNFGSYRGNHFVGDFDRDVIRITGNSNLIDGNVFESTYSGSKINDIGTGNVIGTNI